MTSSPLSTAGLFALAASTAYVPVSAFVANPAAVGGAVGARRPFCASIGASVAVSSGRGELLGVPACAVATNARGVLSFVRGTVRWLPNRCQTCSPEVRPVPGDLNPGEGRLSSAASICSYRVDCRCGVS